MTEKERRRALYMQDKKAYKKERNDGRNADGLGKNHE